MSGAGEPAKRKEIYTYCADWEIYGMSWTVRPDQRFRLQGFGSAIYFSNRIFECALHLERSNLLQNKCTARSEGSEFKLSFLLNRLALGSFIEEYANKVQVSTKPSLKELVLNDQQHYTFWIYLIFQFVMRVCICECERAHLYILFWQIVQLSETSGEFRQTAIFDHPYPTTKIMWIPDKVL